MNERIDEISTDTGEGPAIAIIGMAGRFPGAGDIAGFARMIREGGTGIRPIPPERLAAAGRRPEDLARPGFVAVEAPIDQPLAFDAGFFNLPPREAARLDPQLRNMAETAWHAFEDAATDPRRAGTRCAVYAAANLSTWWLAHLAARYDDDDPAGLIADLIGNGQDYPATWIAHRLGLTGPALNVLTACSSGLAVVATACQALCDYSADRALAVAGSIAFPQGRGYRAEGDSIHSPSGRCRPFDAAADGTVSGDGVGAVLLRRLEDARADGDPIRAVIRGFAINNDGGRKAGYSAPSIDGQADVLAEAAALAGIIPGDLDFIEAHGTGTRLGDPIEVAALARVHGAAAAPIALTAAKAAIGHLETAAGMAGLIRTVLGLQARLVPPVPGFTQPNPLLKLDETPFRIADRPRPIAARGRPARAGVSAFGFGGTNVHLIVEEAPAAPLPDTRPGHVCLPLSAADPAALDRLRRVWIDRLQAPDAPDAAIAAATARAGRARLPWRLAATGTDAAALAADLARQSPQIHGRQAPHRPRLALVFPGQGVPTGRILGALARDHAAARAVLDDCDAALAELGRPPVSAWLTDPGSAPPDPVEVDRSHVAGFAFGLALARVLGTRGLSPDLVLGHSVGEITAATVAGAFDTGDAVRLLDARARAFRDDAPDGLMLAVALSADALAPLMAEIGPDALWPAALNGDGQSVVAGRPDAVRGLAARMAADGVPHRIVAVPRPAHTPLMAGCVPRLAAALARIGLRTPDRAMLVSTVTGGLVDGAAARAEHWTDQLTRPVRFAEAVAAAETAGVTTFFELSPRPVLAQAGRACIRDAAWITVFDDETADGVETQALLARIEAAAFQAGHEADHAAPAPRAGGLPAYPFARDIHEVPLPARTAATAAEALPVRPIAPAPAVAPSQAEDEDPLLAVVCEIWAERLGLPAVGADDDFFRLGGTSLAALQILTAIEEAAGLRPPLGAIAEGRTPRALADRLAALAGDEMIGAIA
ncbi:type I polyketide synthase [Tistrella mobilis]|uniref:type I polyketide synthase n=1 Tax=Tistrella mobilis TaxID=171437 RepID=UPI003557297E